MATLRILLVDDHAVVREGLKRLIAEQPDIEVVGEASDGHEAIEHVKTLRPDVVMMDVSMPRLSGVEATRELKGICPATRILALTVHEDEAYVREFLKAGAAGYLLKRAPTEELVRAIRAVAGGGVYIDPRVTTRLVQMLSQPERASTSTTLDLSERETEVLRLIAQGYANKEIAAQLDLSVKTVETYKARSMEKLGLRSRVDIVRVAVERGWLQR
jgi:DNA-binding NarL/FixJ family response regulator